MKISYNRHRTGRIETKYPGHSKCPGHCHARNHSLRSVCETYKLAIAKLAIALAGLLFIGAGCQSWGRVSLRSVEPASGNRASLFAWLRDPRGGDVAQQSHEPVQPVSEDSGIRSGDLEIQQVVHDDSPLVPDGFDVPSPEEEITFNTGPGEIAGPGVVEPMLNQEDSLSLADFEAIALESNPAIQQASASAYKAMGFRDQVGRKPNPAIGYNASQMAVNDEDQHMFFIEQDVILGGKLQRNQDVLNQEILAQLWEVEAQRYRVLTDIRRNFYESLAAQRRMELAEDFARVAEKGAVLEQSRQDAGEGSRPEVLQAEIQFQQARLKRQQAEAAFHGAWRRLVATAGVPQLTVVRLDGTLTIDRPSRDWDATYVQLLAASPELRAARSRLCRAQANLDRQEVQAIPNLSFMVGAGPDNASGQNMVTAQVALPVPVFNWNQGNITAAQAEVCRASQEIRRMEMSLQSRLGTASSEYESAEVALHSYEREILPRAQENLDLAENAYRVGQFDFLQVYTVRRIYFDANMEYIDAQLALALAASNLNGLLLSGGLDETPDTDMDAFLRDQAMNGL